MVPGCAARTSPPFQPPQHPSRYLGAVDTCPKVSALGGQSPRTALLSADITAW